MCESVDLSSSSSDESISSSHNNVERKTSVELLQAPDSVDEVEVRSSVDEVEVRSSVDEVEVRSSVDEVEVRSSVDEVEVMSSVDEVEIRSSVDEVEVRSSVDEVEVRSSVDEVKRTDSVDSSADNNLRVDDLDESLGLSRLFAETKQITWNDVTNLDKESLQKLQQDCDNLKPLFKISHPEKQIVNGKSYFYIDDNLLMHCCKHKNPDAEIDVIQIVVPKCLRKELL